MPSCPYSDCGRQLPAGAEESCPACRRLLKLCARCSHLNRAFANYCGHCAELLPESPEDWSAFKGGPRRLGATQSLGGPFSGLREVLDLRLGDVCRSLLSSDRHLIAVAKNGAVEIVDVARGGQPLRLRADGPVSCEPCVSRGTLFLGAPGHVSAYALGALALRPPRLEPLWDVRLPATPIQALTALENRLYVTVAHPESKKSESKQEVYAIDGIHGRVPPTLRRLFAGKKLSWVAADPATRGVFFLSDDGGGLWLHSVDHSQGESPGVASRRLLQVPAPLAAHLPVAVLGDRLFGVFGENDRLCRIDTREGVFDQGLREDTKTFSLSGLRDGLHVDNAMIYFLGLNVFDSLNPIERVKGAPAILGERAAAVALQDGRIRVYDLHNPPRHEVLRLGDDAAEVTALAAFRGHLAGGDARGVVKVFALA